FDYQRIGKHSGRDVGKTKGTRPDLTFTQNLHLSVVNIKGDTLGYGCIGNDPGLKLHRRQVQLVLSVKPQPDVRPLRRIQERKIGCSIESGYQQRRISL